MMFRGRSYCGGEKLGARYSTFLHFPNKDMGFTLPLHHSANLVIFEEDLCLTLTAVVAFSICIVTKEVPKPSQRLKPGFITFKRWPQGGNQPCTMTHLLYLFPENNQKSCCET